MLPQTIFEPIDHVRGVGPQTARQLAKLNIFTSRDLLLHFPHRHINYQTYPSIAQAPITTPVSVTATIQTLKNTYRSSYKTIQTAIVQDKTSTLTVLWFNQPYLLNSLKKGQEYIFSGSISLFGARKQMLSPEWEKSNTQPSFITGIVPVYPETKGVSSKLLRKLILSRLAYAEYFPDFLGKNIRSTNGLMDLATALKEIHSPSSQATLSKAIFRLSLNEILEVQAQAKIRQQLWRAKTPQTALTATPNITKTIARFIRSLPYQLTASQISVWNELKTDLLTPSVAMNRLLQGDVGSGKTVIAFLGILLTHLNQALSVLVAPTELLARQHYQTAVKFLAPFGVKIALVTSATAKAGITDHTLLVGTHALFFRKKLFQNPVSFLVIDEQHRFGVKERHALMADSHPPHTLTMTATPIPRSVNLVFLGDLTVSRLTQLPSGRKPVKTYVVPESKRLQCYRWLTKHLVQTHTQGLIVCPFIDESESMTSVKSAIQEYSKLKALFPSLTLGLLHGKIQPPEKTQIINDVLAKKIDILVATPIVEVGMDLPNLSAIIIESAERFGLAQLHQLRGRVGRNNQQAYCYLFSPTVTKKLAFFAHESNGYLVAEYDLRQRGPGLPLSTAQHGFTTFKLANLYDKTVIHLALDLLTKHPHLTNKVVSRLPKTALSVAPN